MILSFIIFNIPNSKTCKYTLYIHCQKSWLNQWYNTGEFHKEVIGNCSVKCGSGTRIVTKIVCKFSSQMMDSIEESQCTNSKEEIPCELDPCPIIFKYQTWSEWNECSKTCKKGIDDKGLQFRTRTCEPAKDCNIGKIGKICFL